MKRGRPPLDDLDQEIREHIEHETQENIERGMTPEEARRAALRKFGNVTLAKEDVRAVWTPVWIEQLLQDVRYGVRTLRRNPGFSTVVVLTLALGIGMNTAVFSVFDAVLLRPLQYPDSDRLLWLAMQGEGVPLGMEALSTQDFWAWREQASSFESMVAYEASDQTVATSADAGRARIASVSDDFWPMTNARVAMGRLPEPGEQDTMVLAHGYFERRFHGDPEVVGRVVTVNGKPMTITGVLSREFLFQLPPPNWPSFDASKSVDAYRPVVLQPHDRVVSRFFGRILFVAAKLKPGVSIERARVELEALRGRTAEENPTRSSNGATLVVTPLQEKLVGEARSALWVLLGAVVFVLLMACAGIANLLLARSSVRQKEAAIRSSVGAGRSRLLCQFLVESALLAVLGALGGLLLAHWGLALLVRLIPDAVPRLTEATIDVRVLAFAFGITIVAACLVGVAPAISFWQANLRGLLGGGVRTSSATSGTVRTRGLLVTAEIALAVVLLSGAGLMIKSFWRMNALAPGLDPEHTLVMKIQLTGPQYFLKVASQRAYAEKVLRKLETLPGVEAAAITSPDQRASVHVKGITRAPDGDWPMAVYNVTSAAAARVMGLRVVRGRWFTDAEPTSVMVINESLARSAFGGEDPIGKRIRRRGRPPRFATVVGVVADLKYSKLDQDPEPELYIPYAEAPLILGMTMMVRTTGDPMAVAPMLREAVAGIDKTQAAYDLMTLEQALADSIAPRRFNLFLLGTFAVTALLLALIGVYGVIAYSVAQRTHEIGIRMALGARRAEVVRMVLRQGVGISLAGIVVGLIGAVVLTRFMETLLYEVEPNDPQTFAAVALGLGVTALAACWIPALRAATVDPVTALRGD